MTTEQERRREHVHDRRWTEDRSKAPTVRDLCREWPDMATCEHPDVDVRTLANGHGIVIHFECKDCPKSCMRLIKRADLMWPGEEFSIMFGALADPEDRPEPKR